MRQLICIMICVLCLFVFVKTSVSADIIAVEEEFLNEILERLEKDRAIIQDLKIYRDELEQKIWLLENDIATLKLQLRQAKGLYVGGGVGYPFPMAQGIVEYRFARWGLMGFGGYGGGPFIGIGTTIKIGGKE